MVWETVWPLLNLGLIPGMSVADIGAENSCLTPYFASLGCHAYGVDLFLGSYGDYFKERILDLCRKRTLVLNVRTGSNSESRAEYTCQDATLMNFKTAAFDRIVCLSTIEHIPDDRAAMREMARILKPGGILAITTPIGPRYRQLSDRPHWRGSDGKWHGDLERIYCPDTIHSRLIKPSGLKMRGAEDSSFRPSVWDEHRLPGQSVDFCSVALFLEKPTRRRPA